MSEWTRWRQLVLGIICMVTIANLQYGWTLFINPIDQKYHWGRAAIQVAFTIYIVTELWVVPFAGYLIDRFGCGFSGHEALFRPLQRGKITGLSLT